MLLNCLLDAATNAATAATSSDYTFMVFQDLNHETTLLAANGVKFSAKKVFSYSLRFFREHALRELSDQSGVKIMSDDVKWVLTVPAIWKQPAKQFMREAAYEVWMITPTHSNGASFS